MEFLQSGIVEILEDCEGCVFVMLSFYVYKNLEILLDLRSVKSDIVFLLQQVYFSCFFAD